MKFFKTIDKVEWKKGHSKKTFYCRSLTGKEGNVDTTKYVECSESEFEDGRILLASLSFKNGVRHFGIIW